MPVVPLPRSCSAEPLLRALDDAGVLQTTEPVELALPRGAFLDCSGLATLASWGASRRAAGATITFSGDPDGLGYLSRMNLFRLTGFDFPEGPRLLARGRFIALTEAPDAFDVTNAICDLALHHFADGRAFVPALEWAINEVVGNIATHADAPRPGLVCAQYFPQRHRLEVAVVDAGRGILASLREGHPVDSHAAAIDLALQRGVTRSRDVGQGNGLAGTREIVHANGGYLALWTGDVKYRMSKGEETGFVPIPPVEGTGLMLALDTRRPVDLRDTFIQGVAWNYIEATAETLDASALRITDSCAFFGARAPAKLLRRKLQALLPDMTKPLVLDFTGVPTASSSFLDELLGRLAEELGPEEFRRRIQVRNATDAVRERANVVVSQRVGPHG